MRDWNCYPRIVIIWRNTVFSVPMRDWNTHRANLTKGINEFLAYLWGIETSTTYCSTWTGTCVFSVPMRDWNGGEKQQFQRQLLVFSVPMRDWNIRSIEKTANIAGGVFSVPMRDWNWLRDVTSASSFAFLAYLWGIETPKLVQDGRHLCRF